MPRVPRAAAAFSAIFTGAQESPARSIESSPLQPLLASFLLLPLLSSFLLSPVCGCPCKAMDQPTTQGCSSRPGGQSSSSRPFDEQKVQIDLSQPAGHQSLQQASTPTEMEDEPTDLELLLTGPKNEQHLDECLGVAGRIFDCYSPQMEDQFDLLNVDDSDEAAVNELEFDDYIDPSMLGCFLPSGSLGHGRRGPRSSSSSERSGLFAHNFGSREPSTSGGSKHRGRKNNDHWMEDEVRQLVKGVSFHGVGKWSYVKRKYFQASIRTPVHLKDKWKNLVKACKKENGRMLLHLEQSLIEHIKDIDANDPYPKQSNNDEDRLAPISPNNLCSMSSPSLLAQWSKMKTRTKNGGMLYLKNNKEDTTIISPI